MDLILHFLRIPQSFQIHEFEFVIGKTSLSKAYMAVGKLTCPLGPVGTVTGTLPNLRALVNKSNTGTYVGAGIGIPAEGGNLGARPSEGES